MDYWELLEITGVYKGLLEITGVSVCVYWRGVVQLVEVCGDCVQVCVCDCGLVSSFVVCPANKSRFSLPPL